IFSRDWSSDVCSSDLAAVRVNLNRHLIRRTTDAPGLDLNHRRNVLESLLEDLNRVTTSALLDLVHRLVHDPPRDALLAVLHQTVDEHRDLDVVVLRIRINFTLGWPISPGHTFSPASRPESGRQSLSLTSYLIQ